MAVENGTATNYLDLLGKLVTFLTTGIGGAEDWTVLANTTSGFTTDGEVYLRAPGLAGTDEIYVNIQTYKEAVNNIYTWRLQGAIDFDSGLTFDTQPGSIALGVNTPRMLLVNSSVGYTFVANGQRAIVIVKDTVVETAYLGWVTPYAPPSYWAQPLFIGGMANADLVRSNTTVNHAWFLNDRNTGAAGASSGYLRMATNLWARTRGDATPPGLNRESTELRCWTHPYYQQTLSANGGESGFDGITIENGDYLLYPVMLLANQNANSSNKQEQPVGEFDGIYHVNGPGLSQDDIIEYDGDDYLVVQDAFRTGLHSFAAIRLV